MKIWECVVCGIVYDEAKGWPEENIAPGTKWDDVPSDWLCPDCGVGKDAFEMVEIQFLIITNIKLIHGGAGALMPA